MTMVATMDIFKEKQWLVPENGLSWLSNYQNEALSSLKKIGFPSPSFESWKYIDLGAVYDSSFDTKVSSVSDEYNAQFSIDDSYEIRYENGVLTLPNELEDGVTITLFSQLSDDQKTLVLKELRDNKKDENPFSLLNSSQFTEGVFVHVKRGVTLKRPISLHLASKTQEKTIFYPRFLTVVEDEAELVFSVQAQDNSELMNLTNAIFDLTVGKQATAEFIFSNKDGNQAVRFDDLHVNLAEKSQFHGSFFSTGGAKTRHDVEINFHGIEADSQLAGVTILSDDSEVYTHTQVNHFVGHCTSDQLFKNVLSGKSRSEYNGLVYVYKDSQKTDSRQSNKNLLLSDNARAFARPQLRIYADDVECAHGSSTGQLDDEQLYYIQSRGIDLAQARSILLAGFVEEVVDKVQENAISKEIESKILLELNKM